MKIPLGLLALALACSPGVAQCNGLTFTSYGNACGTAFPAATLAGSFDPATCSGALTLNAFPGCCNSFQTQNVWVVGVNQVQLPLPGVTPPCFLLASPDHVFVTPPTQNVFSFPVPPSFSGLTLHAQAAKVYFTTIGFTLDVSLTNGLTVVFL